MDLPQAVRAAQACPRALEELQALYARADADILAAASAGDIRCLGGGGCCKFDLFDHRLYASTLELALLFSGRPGDLSRAAGQRCPYQSGPACKAYERRVLGCRTFFCRDDRRLVESLHERYHAEIIQLHSRHELDYQYAQVTLAALQLFTYP